MFSMSLLPNVLRAQSFFDLGKQLRLFIVMMALDEAIPRHRIPNKRRLICIFDMGSLEVDRVVSSQNGVVYVRHVRRANGEDVVLTR
jgi:hypothetical protein